MELPTISVVTPSLNSGGYIEDAILSVAQQVGVRVEHLVQDSLSNDNTMEVLSRYPKLRWRRERDRGQSDAINRGFLRATGELVGWLNADDYYLPGGLEAVARTAAENPEADVIYGDCVFVDGKGRVVRSKVEHEFDTDILYYFGCYIPSTATFFRRRVIDAGHLLDCNFRVCMDFEYFVRLAAQGYRFHYVPKFVAAFRWHESNVSLRNEGRRRHERCEVQCLHPSRTRTAMEMELLRQGMRGKRLVRKLMSGNAWRELQIRRRQGTPTLWMRDVEAQAACTSLACL